MSVNRIATRYAKSLLDLAVDQQVLDAVKGDVELFARMIENRDLYLLLKSPIINATKKESVFKVLFGDRFNKLTMAFFNIVLKKGREMYLPEIGKEFMAQYKQLIGLTTVTIVTATPMDAGNLAQIKSKLMSSNETAKDVELLTKVDANIIGGFVLEIGDKLFDNSIAHKLKQIRKSLSNKDFVKTI
ncbi:MAG: ATP synthase F1 subunit delta [Saprospiraceae bacterium]|nr:ATP synthase F1 subunit delta [Saprospiraceae bacterium]